MGERAVPARYRLFVSQIYLSSIGWLIAGSILLPSPAKLATCDLT